MTSQSDAVIEIRDISKHFRLYQSVNDRVREILHPFRKVYHTQHWALKNISLSFGRGETVGILGRNGTGKSTLLALVAGILQPSEGFITTRGKLATLLELGAGFRPELSGRDNAILHGILQGMTYPEIQGRLHDIEAFADIGEYFDQPVRTYSSGMFLRAAFSAAIHSDPDILVVDEALSVGDAYFQAKCFNRFRELQEQNKTILFVSHDMQQISRVCNRAVVLSDCQVIYDGPAPEGINTYESLLHGNIKRSIHTSEKKDHYSGYDTLVDLNDHVQRYHLHPGFNPDHYRIGDGRAQLLDILMVCNNTENPRSIPSGAGVDIYMKFSIQQTIERPSYGVTILQGDGTMIHGTNTDMKKQTLPPAQADSVNVVRFSFTASLSPGIYALNLGIADKSIGKDEFVDVYRSLIRFEVEGTPGFNGSCDLHSTFSTI